MKTIKTTPIAAVLREPDKFTGREVDVKGWVRTRRGNKNVQFVALNDGSTIKNLQIVFDLTRFSDDDLKAIATGASIHVQGELVASQGKGQSVEVQASELEVYGTADPEKYPLQKKGHSLEFLREIAHLRPRTNTFGAVLRIRHALAFAGRHASLTVSGQLEGELGATALGCIYTFGPTFRAENSNTPRHLSEFWMIEPEMAFYEIEDNMDLAEEFIKYCIGYALEHCSDDIDFLAEHFDKDLKERLDFVVRNDFVRLPYSEGIKILEESGKKFEFPVYWGVDLASEHERFLVEEHFRKPVILTDYPKEIKAFYMKLNDDGKTVRAMDVLFPKIGEIIGGSQREESLEKLQQRVDELGLSGMEWYLDTRRFGSVPHSGFGLGFERLVLFVTGMQNIRDVIPFPRYPNNCEY